jgi:tripartite-type tricarboxylate transporter receptor subunit TctC
MIRHGLSTSLAAFACVLLLSFGAFANETLPRQLRLIVGYGPGGGYDAYARVIARHMPRYLPGAPVITVQNMPGAASLRATNFIYASAPKDGSVFGTVSRDVGLICLSGDVKTVRIDPIDFTWIGSASSYEDDAYLFWVRQSVAQGMNDAVSSKREIVVGITGEGSEFAVFAREALKLPLKTVSGYPDSNALFLAIERGELDGRFVGLSAVRASQATWVADSSQVKPIVQFARRTRHPAYPNVPLARELSLSDSDRALLDLIELPFALSKPYIAPPNLPEPLAKSLQDGFTQVMKDTELLQEFARLGADVSPIDAAEIVKMLKTIQTAPEDVKARMRALMAPAR